MTVMAAVPPHPNPLCAIPVYNNAATLPDVVRRAVAQGVAVLVVDDGSTDANAAELLRDLPATVVRHERNLGKGAAIRTALRHAADRGFSHLVTLDADGQHDPADLPAFLAAIEKNPAAMVIGVRDFSVPNVPGASRFGRRFSNFWVRVETGARLADTQSGFRAYPVAAFAGIPTGSRRYDFEIEALVRGLWAGLPAAEVPIATWYAPPGERISHFCKWRDNLLLTHAHVKLVVRRLCSWPVRRLASKPEAAGPAGKPVRNTRGNALGFWFFRTALALTGLRGAYGLLHFPCTYYWLFDRHGQALADAYLRRRFPGCSWLVRRWQMYRLFIGQGKCLIDRHAYNVGRCEFTFDDHALRDMALEMAKLPGGFVLLLSHTGGWQLALPHLRHLSGARPVSLLMHEAETPDVRAHVRGDDAGFHVISPEGGPASALEMVVRLQRGEIVSIMGDRAYGGQTAEAPFLGGPAYFPASAFAVARAAQCPVLALFVPKTGVFSYAFETLLLPAPAREDRGSIRAGVRRFAEALDSFAQRHPDQCFLFADIWRKGAS